VTPENIAAMVALVSYFKDLGVLGGLVYLIHQLQTGSLVTRKHHEDVVEDRDTQIAKAEAREAEWRRVALGQTTVLEEAMPLVREQRRGKS
jgi:hypothetical protein